jgi:hypothetical protein
LPLRFLKYNIAYHNIHCMDMEKSYTNIIRNILLTCPFLIALLYIMFLGHRGDYVGHYLAGFGGTLVAMMFVLERTSQAMYARQLSFIILWVCLGCLVYGTVLELTAFRLAKFDELDWCNQNLGAVFAALWTMLRVPSSVKPSRHLFRRSQWLGLLCLGIGGYYAFA